MKSFLPPLAQVEPLFRRSLLLTAVLGVALSLSLQFSLVTDPDIWWHLRTGQWILTHGAIPQTDPFSSLGDNVSWVAYSWLFAVILYGFYQAWGLLGIVIYTLALTLLISLALLWLTHQRAQHVSTSIGLTAAGMLACVPLWMPRSWLFTILFFLLELILLDSARQTGKRSRLYWLPLLFAVWANLHIQFIYGLLPLVLWLCEPWLEQCCQRPFAYQNLRPRFARGSWGVVFACVGATLLTPYHWRLYQTLLEIVRQKGMYQYIEELQSLSFRDPSHWIVLALVLGAVFALGWQRGGKPLPVLLLLVGALLAFRAQREVWVVVIAAVWLLATARTATASQVQPTPLLLSVFQVPVILALSGLLLWAMIQRHQISATSLQQKLARSYPVAAAQFVAERNYPGPLYNHFNWGGFLMWNLPHLRVAMDGRANFYGDQRIQRSIATWNGTAKWAEDPQLANARLVIADVTMPLASLLACDSRFERVYRDEVAAVFIARAPAAPPK